MKKIPKATLRAVMAIAWRDVLAFRHRPTFLFVMVVAPVLCTLFFTSLMEDGLPTDLPAGMVDEDDTKVSRTLVRTIDALQLTDIRYKFRSFSEAHQAMREGRIYGFFLIPEGTTREAVASRQPRISFYTNDAYIVPANLLMRDLKTASELTSLALLREQLRARGRTEDEIMTVLQPIVVDTHPLGNPTLDYSVYLSNMLVPGIMILLIMLTTTYSLGIEWKRETQKKLYRLAGQRPLVAITGKLLPQTLLYCVMMTAIDVWFFRVCGFPCQCGLSVMVLLGWLTVMASQGFAVFLFGLMSGEMRVSLCICSLWGILSFSLAGFTYPVTDMSPVLQALAVWFPLRHYYLIYVNQALNGFPLDYVWSSVVWLTAFCQMPLLVLYRYRKAFLTFKYLP